MEPAKIKVLFLEDEVFIGELYARALSKTGYEVELRTNGQDGLEEAATDKYDIILLDLMLPKMSGLDVLKALREKSKTPIKARIIVMTNLEYQGANREEIERLADGYLLKANTTPKQLIEYLQSIDTK